MQEKKEQKKSNSKTQIILIVGFAVVILLICVIGYFIYSSLNKNEPDNTNGMGGNGNLVIDESNLAEVDEMMSQAAAEGTFELNMNTIWNFPDGKSPSSDAYVANGNANSRPISFEILVDEDECVYSSTVIPVGNRIKEIKLDKELPAGEYNATCMYHLWEEDGTENSSFGVGVVLIVKE